MAVCNYNAYLALAIQRDDTVHCQKVDDVVLDGSGDFSFSIQFIACDVSNKIVLFSQEDTIEIGYERGAFYCLLPMAELY